MHSCIEQMLKKSNVLILQTIKYKRFKISNFIKAVLKKETKTPKTTVTDILASDEIVKSICQSTADIPHNLILIIK